MDSKTFTDLGLSKPLLDAIQLLGYESPTPIQSMTIPVALEGHDIVGISQTGSGKTAAFALPTLERVDVKDHSVQMLVICPTRELCMQVCQEIHVLGQKIKKLEVVPVYGGAPIERQIRSIKNGAQVVVGTPGRLIDLLKRKVLKLGGVKTVILDEADRMLDMGFQEDMEIILGTLPESRQSLFFSATMNKDVKALISHYSKNAKQLMIESKSLTVASIEQRYYEVRSRSKVEVLTRILDIEKPKLSIIFCNTKNMVDECTESLSVRGFAVDKIHGDISQGQRERVIRRFRDGHVEILVATDVAARGLDIENVNIVFNYDLPYDSEDYVHRIGRTGRAGRSGSAISFVFGKEIYRLQSIEKYTRQVIQRTPIPKQEEIEGKRADQTYGLLKGRLELEDYKDHSEFVDRLLDQGFTPTDIANALFTILHEANSRTVEEIHEDRSPPPEKVDLSSIRGGSGGGRGGRAGRGGRGSRFRGGSGGGKSKFSGDRGGPKNFSRKDRGASGGGKPKRGPKHNKNG